MSKINTDRIGTRDGTLDIDVKSIMVRDDSMENLGDYEQGLELTQQHQYIWKDESKYTVKLGHAPFVLTGVWEFDKEKLEIYGAWDHSALTNRDKEGSHSAGAITYTHGSEFPDKSLGKELQTLKNNSSDYQIVDSFEQGATITERNQALQVEADGRLYRWAGDLPKTVAAGSSPETTGGAQVGAWLEVSDLTLRQELANPDMGAAMVGRGVVAVDSIADLLALPEGQRKEGLHYSVGGSAYKWVQTQYPGVADGINVLNVSGGSFIKQGVVYGRDEFTVGAGGDFADLNEAVLRLSSLKPAFESPDSGASGGYYVRLTILPGTIIDYQLIVSNGIDLSWMDITTSGQEIQVRASAITRPISSLDYPLFGAQEGSTLPRLIGCVFVFDNSGDGDPIHALRHGVQLRFNSYAYLYETTIRNAGGTGFYASYNSRADLRGCNFPQSGLYGIAARHSSTINARDTGANVISDLTGCGDSAVFSANNSSVYVRYSDIGGNLLGASVRCRTRSAVSGEYMKSSTWFRGVYVDGASTFNLEQYLEVATDWRGSINAEGAGSIIACNDVVAGGAVVVGQYPIIARNSASISIAGDLTLGSGPLVAITAESSATVKVGGINAKDCARSAVLAVDGASVTLLGGDISGALANAIDISRGAYVYAKNLDVTGAAGRGVYCRSTSRIAADGVDFRKGETDSVLDIRIEGGSIAQLRNCQGGSNITPNTLSADGMHIRSAAQ